MSDTEFIPGNCYEYGAPIEYPSYVTMEEAKCPNCQKMIVLKDCLQSPDIPPHSMSFDEWFYAWSDGVIYGAVWYGLSLSYGTVR